VARDGGRVVGWVALAPVSDRHLPRDQASVRLHEACGFRVVEVRERLGRLHGRWRDVLLMERRSPVVT
jgi:L-amino acid N-acyltransferase YncA